MIAQRFVSTNPQANLGVSGLARVPQQPRCVPRRTAPTTTTTVDHAPWLTGTGDDKEFPSGSGNTTLKGVSAYTTTSLPLTRCLYHPNYETVIEYPKNPDRTINYYRSTLRAHNLQSTKTLSSNITVRDPQSFDDVVIREVWEGGGQRLSVLAEFFDTLQLFTMSEPTLGRSCGWIPKDLGFQRHMIQPLSISVGGTEMDVREQRTKISTSLNSYLDRQVVFSFKLIRPMPLIDSLLVMEGN